MELVLKSCVELEQVSYAYEPGKPILCNLNPRFEAGRSYAVVGNSSSGKSTLLNLLLASDCNYQGQIRIDGTELRDISADSLYDLICTMPQNVFIFDSDIRSNVTMFCNFPDEAVTRAIRQPDLTPLVQEKRANYRCDKNGVKLSGGE